MKHVDSVLSRRRFIQAGGLWVLCAPWAALPASNSPVVDVAMGGSQGGAHVWFRPTGIWIVPGQAVRWTNRDSGNSHTATAYHPSLYGKPLRIPTAATPWDSGFLLPGESFSVTFTHPGVYDYYCLPHEMAGMVGRIVVGEPDTQGWQDQPESDAGLPAPALRNFPSVERILKERSVDL
ncbi:MAG TPA: plastocyanin/azurin family copper-binding protein [Burkholderiaceae bacterium]|nr:plastocyanin/azurin family copper-binding protein [Burkholderiaceae bacterium]